jgi:NAD(P)-dependent dehydrogenase (short-subunit alcohol dehydrogenase family)
MAKSALITGGSRGIGFGIAQALARAGYDLAINGVREESEVQEALQTLKKHNVDVIYCQGNLGNADDRKRVIEKTFSHFKVVNVLVNNAGVAPKVRNNLLDLTEEAYDYLMEINLKGTFFFTQQVAKKMISEKNRNARYEASIITITSVSAEAASVNRGEYCLSKAGLAMMTKLFATALAEVNIPVYEVRPGIIETDMTSGVKEKYDKLISEGLTLEKRWGRPDDIGKIVAALAKGDIPYATGQVISPDGGMGVKRL